MIKKCLEHTIILNFVSAMIFHRTKEILYSPATDIINVDSPFFSEGLVDSALNILLPQLQGLVPDHSHSSMANLRTPTAAKYSGTRLIRHRLIRQFAEFVTFSSVPAESLFFVYISVRQFAQFVTSFYPLEAFCSSNSSFAVSL